MTSQPRRRISRALLLCLLVLLLLAGAVVQRLLSRAAQAQRAARREGARRVLIVPAQAEGSSVGLQFTGTLRPLEATTVMARTSGYLRHLEINIGDQVRQGQVLASIEAPEVVDQLRSARAKLQEVQENIGFSQTQVERYQRLVSRGAVSKQEVEGAQSRYNSANASLSSAQAEVERLSALVAYQRVTAPFAGVITRRYVDSGALVSAGTTALFDIATTRALKALVDVPQGVAQGLVQGTRAYLQVPGSEEELEAQVIRTAEALSSTTRTLRVETTVPPEAALLAGAYIRVRFELSRPRQRALPGR